MSGSCAVKKILVLSADPLPSRDWPFNPQLQEIQLSLERSPTGYQFELHQRSAVQPIDIQRALLEINPHIVHLSTSYTADTTALLFHNRSGKAKFVQAEDLADIFNLFSNRLECVILNAPNSDSQAQVIAKSVPYVIGMNQSIDQTTIIDFIFGFYRNLSNKGSVEQTFALACNQLELKGSCYLKLFKNYR